MVLLGSYQHPTPKIQQILVHQHTNIPSMQNIPYAGPPAHLITVLGTSKKHLASHAGIQQTSNHLMLGTSTPATSIPCWSQHAKHILCWSTSTPDYCAGDQQKASSIPCWDPANQQPSHAGEQHTSNQHPMLVPACKTYLMLVTSNAGFFSRAFLYFRMSGLSVHWFLITFGIKL